MAAKKGNKGRKKASKAVVVLAILAVTLFLSGGVLAYGYDQQVKNFERMRAAVEVDYFHHGVYIEGIVPGRIDLGGLSYDQGMEKVMQADAQRLAGHAATLRVEDKAWSVELPAASDAQQIVEQAYQVGRSGELEERYAQIMDISSTGYGLEVTYSCDTSSLRQMVDSIAQEIDVPVVEATVSEFDLDSKSFTFTDEQAGLMLDRQALIADIDAAVAAGVFPIEVTGKALVVEPEFTRAQLEARYGLLATYTTQTTADANRNNNIKLASSTFHGAVIQPGETFSINAATGPRTEAKGYQEAGAILNGRLVPEFGGGVCQVSTTLFNAVVRAGMEIVERNNHSYPISYVPRGMDAMIDYQGGRDLKFTNVSTGPVYLVVHFADRKLTMSVYGTAVLEEGVTIDLRAETTSTTEPGPTIFENDPFLPMGVQEEYRAARTGYRVITYIQYKRGDTVIEEKELFKSNYTAIAQIMRVGTMLPLIDGGGGELPIIMAP